MNRFSVEGYRINSHKLMDFLYTNNKYAEERGHGYTSIHKTNTENKTSRNKPNQ